MRDSGKERTCLGVKHSSMTMYGGKHPAEASLLDVGGGIYIGCDGRWRKDLWHVKRS